MNKNFKKALNYSVVGSLSTMVLSAISGCVPKEEQVQSSNQFMVIEEKPRGVYTVVEQYTINGPSRAVLKDINGNERVINETQMQKLAQMEKQRIENGQSNLTNNSGGALSLGETILAVAGGALLGNLIGNALSNRLMNNQNFQNRQQNAMRNSNFSRSANSATKSSTKKTQARSGFFGSTRQSNKRSFSFGG